MSELRDGMRNIDIQGRISEISDPREVNLRRGGTARVADATFEDETGAITLSLWNEDIERVTTNDTVKIENGYTNTFRGEVQLNVGRYGELKVVEE